MRKKTPLSIVGLDGKPIIKESSPILKRCNFCGTGYDVANLIIVSSNGLAGICDACLGGAIFYMKNQHGYVVDYDKLGWRKADDGCDARKGDSGSDAVPSKKET